MKACITSAPAPVATSPLQYTDIPDPQPLGTNVRIRVRACAVCRTDLHIIEGELPWRKRPIIPGHQVVGTIDAMGNEAKRFPIGTRVGVAWLQSYLRRMPILLTRCRKPL